MLICFYFSKPRPQPPMFFYLNDWRDLGQGPLPSVTPVNLPANRTDSSSDDPTSVPTTDQEVRPGTPPPTYNQVVQESFA